MQRDSVTPGRVNYSRAWQNMDTAVPMFQGMTVVGRFDLNRRSPDPTGWRFSQSRTECSIQAAQSASLITPAAGRGCVRRPVPRELGIAAVIEDKHNNGSAGYAGFVYNVLEQLTQGRKIGIEHEIRGDPPLLTRYR